MRGKDATQACTPLPDELLPTLKSYLTYDRPLCPTSERLSANPNALAGSAVYGQLSERACFDIVVRYATTAGLTGHHPHRLRHSYATDLLRRGASLEEVRRLLGHSAITTGVRYLHLTDRDTRTCIDKAFQRTNPCTHTPTPSDWARDSASLPASPARVR